MPEYTSTSAIGDHVNDRVSPSRATESEYTYETDSEDASAGKTSVSVVYLQTPHTLLYAKTASTRQKINLFMAQPVYKHRAERQKLKIGTK